MAAIRTRAFPSSSDQGLSLASSRVSTLMSQFSCPRSAFFYRGE